MSGREYWSAGSKGNIGEFKIYFQFSTERRANNCCSVMEFIFNTFWNWPTVIKRTNDNGLFCGKVFCNILRELKEFFPLLWKNYRTFPSFLEFFHLIKSLVIRTYGGGIVIKFIIDICRADENLLILWNFQNNFWFLQRKSIKPELTNITKGR